MEILMITMFWKRRIKMEAFWLLIGVADSGSFLLFITLSANKKEQNRKAKHE